ncbi:MAG: biotin/lipoyl-binding protein, partial [Rubrivivax sp.]|nr:biotin/lipoyl-binding protein [Rubrivivax sp.]
MSGEADVRQRHPAVDLLRRYRSVFAAAWEARHELAGPKRLASEAAFLPAALEIQETPVHPAPRRAAWAIMALFTIVVVWSIVGQVDIVAVAHGRIVVSDGTKVVQPLEAGVIRAIHVRDGDKVTAGQVLIELDATSAAADRIGVDQQLGAARQDAARALAL